MDLLLQRRVEEASLSAWPATHQLLIDGWIARLSSGYTKRANSIVPLYPSTGQNLDLQVATCERLYERHGLPAIFRLLSFSAPAGLDTRLEQRGYGHLDGTRVMIKRLTDTQAHRAGTVLERRTVDLWLGDFARTSEANEATNTLHRDILNRIPTEAGYFSLRSEIDGSVLACGLAVVDGPLVGLFDIVTSPAHRRQGYATHLIQLMANWACVQGASTAYLQVVEANQPAISLYEALGFADLYRYWYRVPPAM